VKEILKLNGIVLEYGTREDDIYIPRGARKLSQTLSELGVPNRLEIFNGTHTSEVNHRIESRLLPFFSSVLGNDAARTTPIRIAP